MEWKSFWIFLVKILPDLLQQNFGSNGSKLSAILPRNVFVLFCWSQIVVFINFGFDWSGSFSFWPRAHRNVLIDGPVIFIWFRRARRVVISNSFHSVTAVWVFRLQCFPRPSRKGSRPGHPHWAVVGLDLEWLRLWRLFRSSRRCRPWWSAGCCAAEASPGLEETLSPRLVGVRGSWQREGYQVRSLMQLFLFDF